MMLSRPKAGIFFIALFLRLYHVGSDVVYM